MDLPPGSMTQHDRISQTGFPLRLTVFIAANHDYNTRVSIQRDQSVGTLKHAQQKRRKHKNSDRAQKRVGARIAQQKSPKHMP